MPSEHLSPHEAKNAGESGQDSEIQPILTQDWVTKNYREQFFMLESFRTIINLKTYYAIAEKLKLEQAECMRLLEANQEETINLSRYSLVLDPTYFEQLFFN